MNKRRLLALILSAVLLVPTVAYAKGNSNNGENAKGKVVSEEKKENNKDNKKEVDKEVKKENNGTEKKQANEIKKEEKKEQIASFKEAMRAKHETMKAIKQETIEVKKEIQDKKVKLEGILNDIKEGNKEISEETLKSLLEKVESFKTHTKEVKATEDINKNIDETQDKVNKKDFNNALASLDKVIGKLQARLDALKKLNADIDEALALVNTSK